MGNTICPRVFRSGMIIRGIVGPVGMWESRQRFPRTGERVEILVLDFQAFHRPAFPRAEVIPAPICAAIPRAGRDETHAGGCPESRAAPARTTLRNNARRGRAIPAIHRRKSR